MNEFRKCQANALLRGARALILPLLFAACSGAGDSTLLEAAAPGASGLSGGEIGQTEQALSCEISEETRVERGFWMDSSVSFDNTTGLAEVSTTVSSSKSASGFTGGVILVFVDAAGVPIYATDLHQYGVGACGFRCPKSRTVNWSTYVPYGLLSRISGIAILHSHAARYGALFKSLHIAHAIAEVCAGAFDIDGCEIAAGAIEVGTDLLQDVVADELQDTLRDLLDSTAGHIQNCW